MKTVCFLPGSIGRRLFNMSNYVLTSEKLLELGDRYYYNGQAIGHVNSKHGEWLASVTGIDKNIRGLSVSNYRYFKDLQEAINWRNKKACKMIQSLAVMYIDVLPKNVYDILSKFKISDLIKLTSIQHYTYNTVLHNIICQIIKSNKTNDIKFIYDTLGIPFLTNKTADKIFRD